MPARRCIDCVLEVLVDGDSAARTIIESVAAFDEDGISPVLVDFFRSVNASGAEELSEILGNLAEIATLFSIEFKALLSLEICMFLDGTAIFHVEAHLLKSRCNVLTSRGLIGKCRAICLTAKFDIEELSKCIDFVIIEHLFQRIHILLAGSRQLVCTLCRQSSTVLIAELRLDFLSAVTIGILVIVLDGSVCRIGQINLIGIDIIELREGQRCLVLSANQLDLNVVSKLSRRTIDIVDNLNRVFRIDKQLDIGADIHKFISAGTFEPIDDIVDAVAGVLEQALVADGLEVPISVEAVAVGIRLNVAALAESGFHVPAAEPSGFLHGIIRVEMAVLVRGVVCFRTVQQIAVASLVEQVVFQTHAVHSSSKGSGWSHSNHRARHKPEIPVGHK